MPETASRAVAYAPMMPQTTTPAPSNGPVARPGQDPSGTPATLNTPAPGVASPREIYLGLRESREVLWNQKSRLEDEREGLVEQLREGRPSDIDRTGIEQRIAAVDQQIAKVSIDIAEADAKVAQQAAVPGSIEPERPENPWQYGPPEELVAMGLAFSALLLFPIAIAWARRLWRKANVVSAVPPELTDRVVTMERNLETIALEIERIGEGQRFVTQLMAERSGLKHEALPEPRKTPPA